MNRRPGRNDPCSCGSGRKYKNCCEGKARLFGQKVPGAAIWAVVGVVGVGVAAYAMLRRDRPDTTTTSSSVVPMEQRPAPYTYDSLRNQHFDPVHGHWHDGRPPASTQATGTGTATPGAAPAPAPAPGAPPAANAPSPTNPEPWTYDSAKNQHWDPGHQHWHPGPPPPGR